MTSLLIISTTYAADPFNRPSCLYNLDVAAIKSATGITDTDTKEQVFNKISKKKDSFLDAVVKTIKEKCLFETANIKSFNDFMDDSETIPIKLKINNALFVDIPITRSTFSQHLALQTHVVVLTNPSRFIPGTVVTVSDLQSDVPNHCAGRYYEKQYFANNTPCSDTPLSDAAKNSFINKYKYNFALAKNSKLLTGELYQRTEYCLGKRIQFTPVVDTNYYRQRENVRKFSEQLKNTACTGENITVYVMYESSPKDNKYIVLDGPYIIP